eukprot:TRINITY_DN4324_c0_g2_i1.p1 TRINITY_DN4324_c0_g2~~TRINITY_DN4324_c0_g2_i1.p1  ORF type:complete len:349 (+),score=123.71 TRINITY_DN4324_c0_g2_i1:125-1048(+)
MSSDVFALRGNEALYTCLGVGRRASEAEIKRAFRRLAAQLHPDKNPAGEDRFKEVAFAYRVLSDPEQRHLYDSQRLRQRINQRRDPATDPDAELSPEALRDFIEQLMRDEREQEERRRSFDARRRDEYARRERFSSEHPTFAMPALPSIDSVRAKYGLVGRMVTTAELHGELERKAAEREAGPPRLAPELSVRPSSGVVFSAANLHRAAPDADSLDAFCQGSSGATARQRALDAHRSARSATRRPQYRADLSFVEKQKQYYNGDVNFIRQKVKDFDYTRYVQGSQCNRAQLADAILSDALDDYVPGF